MPKVKNYDYCYIGSYIIWPFMFISQYKLIAIIIYTDIISIPIYFIELICYNYLGVQLFGVFYQFIDHLIGHGHLVSTVSVVWWGDKRVTLPSEQDLANKTKTYIWLYKWMNECMSIVCGLLVYIAIHHYIPVGTCTHSHIHVVNLNLMLNNTYMVGLCFVYLCLDVLIEYTIAVRRSSQSVCSLKHNKYNS